MNPIIRKELRSLAVPAGLVAAATGVGTWGAIGNTPWQLLFGFAWFLGVPLVAVSAFGAEFHHRTMTLLLAQPVARGRMWMNKWLCLAGVVGLLAAVQVAALAWAVPPSASTSALWTMNVPSGQLRAVVFFVMVVCSAPLWTLLARSMVGGFVATSIMILYVEAIITCLAWLSSRAIYWFTGDTHVVFGPATPAADGIRAIYSLVTLWLGSRVFAGFQVSAAGFLGGSSTELTSARWAVLRPRRAGSLGNIIRKEFALHRPTFLVSAAFVAGWLCLWLLRARTGLTGAPAADALNGVVLLAYMPFVVGLTGILPMGEDCSLGVRAWHLTLPVSTRRQWALKLLVSLVVGYLLALVLPALLAAVIANEGAVFQVTPAHFLRPTTVLLVTGGIVLGFWASSLFGDTVKAAVGTGTALFALAFVTSLGRSLGDLAGRRMNWSGALNAAERMPFRSGSGDRLAAALFLLLVCSFALRQSLASFRLEHVSRATIARTSLALLAVTFLTAFALAAALSWLDIGLT